MDIHNSQKETLISVIIPVYNVECYIEKCVNSILNNKVEYKYEIILIDDGSTDNSGLICDKYAEKYSNISVHHQKNSGLSSSRNIGIELAEGEYILLIDSDDWVSANMLADLEKLCLNASPDIISFDFTAVSENEINVEKQMGFKKRELNNELISGYEAVQELFLGHIRNYAVMNLYKKSLFKRNNISFPVGRNYEDVGTTYKLLYSAESVYLLNEKLYFYLQRQGSISHINKIEDVHSILKNYEEINAFFSKSNKDKNFINLLKVYQIQKLFTGYRIIINLKTENSRNLEKKIKKIILKEASNISVIKLLPRNQVLKVVLLKLNLLKKILRK